VKHHWQIRARQIIMVLKTADVTEQLKTGQSRAIQNRPL